MSILVADEVAHAKFEQEVSEVLAAAPLLAKRGLVVVHHEYPYIRVLFTVPRVVPLVTLFRADFDYSNYNLWAPSVRFVHPISGEPLPPQFLPPILQPQADGGKRSVLVGAHPDTGLPFLCLPGVREYHTHPEHTGDSWDRYRYRGDGRMFVLLDRLWMYTMSWIKGVQILFMTEDSPPQHQQPDNAPIGGNDSGE